MFGYPKPIADEDFAEINDSGEHPSENYTSSTESKVAPFTKKKRLEPSEVYKTTAAMMEAEGFTLYAIIHNDDESTSQMVPEFARIFQRTNDNTLYILYYPGKDNDLAPNDRSSVRSLRYIIKQADATLLANEEALQLKLENAKKLFIICEQNTYGLFDIEHYIKADVTNGFLTTEDSVDRDYDEAYITSVISHNLNQRAKLKRGTQNPLMDDWSCGHHVIQAIHRDLTSQRFDPDFYITSSILRQHTEWHQAFKKPQSEEQSSALATKVLHLRAKLEDNLIKIPDEPTSTDVVQAQGKLRTFNPEEVGRIRDRFFSKLIMIPTDNPIGSSQLERSDESNLATVLSAVKSINSYLKVRAGETAQANWLNKLVGNYNGTDYYERRNSWIAILKELNKYINQKKNSSHLNKDLKLDKLILFIKKQASKFLSCFGRTEYYDKLQTLITALESKQTREWDPEKSPELGIKTRLLSFQNIFCQMNACHNTTKIFYDQWSIFNTPSRTRIEEDVSREKVLYDLHYQMLHVADRDDFLPSDQAAEMEYVNIQRF